jgi:hypothetical protein
MDLTIPTALTLGPQEQGAVETSFDTPPVRLTGVFMDDGTAPGKHSVSGIKLRAMDRYQLQGEALSADQRRCLPTLWTGDFSAHHADPACAAAFGQVRSVRNCSIGLSSEGCWRPARACCRAGKPPAGFTERPAQTDAPRCVDCPFTERGASYVPRYWPTRFSSHGSDLVDHDCTDTRQAHSLYLRTIPPRGRATPSHSRAAPRSMIQ